jgi:hypothetical protein
MPIGHCRRVKNHSHSTISGRPHLKMGTTSVLHLEADTSGADAVSTRGRLANGVGNKQYAPNANTRSENLNRRLDFPNKCSGKMYQVAGAAPGQAFSHTPNTEHGHRTPKSNTKQSEHEHRTPNTLNSGHCQQCLINKSGDTALGPSAPIDGCLFVLYNFMLCVLYASDLCFSLCRLSHTLKDIERKLEASCHRYY